MNHNKKQFCIRNHDTFICGRYKNGQCNICRIDFLHSPEQKKKANERTKKYLQEHPDYSAKKMRKWRKAHPKTKLGPTWVNEYFDELLTLRNRKTGEFFDVQINNEEIPYLKYFQWYPAWTDRYHKYVRIVAVIPDGYKAGNKLVYLYQVVMKVQKVDRIKAVVDHIRGNTLDNRKESLEVKTQSENSRNNYKERLGLQDPDYLAKREW